MITEFFITVFQGFIEWIVGLLGDDDPPAWLDGVAGFLADLIEGAAGLGAWFPFVLFGTVWGTLGVLWFAFWAVKAARWLWGLTPFSGGS